MKKTSVIIGNRMLEQVRSLHGTVSIQNTVDRALREFLRKEAPRQEIAALSEVDGLDLANERIGAKAWHS